MNSVLYQQKKGTFKKSPKPRCIKTWNEHFVVEGRKRWRPKPTWKVVPTSPEWKPIKKKVLAPSRHHRTPALPFPLNPNVSRIVTDTTHFLKCTRSIERLLPLTFLFLHKTIKPHFLKKEHKRDEIQFAIHHNLLHIEISYRDHLLCCWKLGPYSKCGCKISSSGKKTRTYSLVDRPNT